MSVRTRSNESVKKIYPEPGAVRRRSDRISGYWTMQQQGLFARVVVAIRCW